MIGGPLRVVLQSPSEAAYVAVVRAAVAGAADTAGLDPRVVSDLQTSVSEACNNVVLSAYDEGVGPMWTRLQVGSDAVRMVVRDYGFGFSHVSSEPHAGLGMALIGALADEVEYRNPERGGTEVEMSFHAAVDLSKFSVCSDWPPPARTFAADQLRLWVSPVALLGRVLVKIVVLLAAGAEFTLPGVERARGVAALVARYIELASPAAVEIAFTKQSSRLALAFPDVELPSSDQAEARAEGARKLAREQTLSELASAVDWLGHDSDGAERQLRLELKSS